MQLTNDKSTSNVAGGDEYGEGGAIDACYPFAAAQLDSSLLPNLAVGSGSTQETDGDSEWRRHLSR